ncbi:hypothetical protein ABEB36_004843 [Hypothenemus hampei]|uniref:PHD-type domain-containing protein n=1 Tax=Hypothenemus hampei TaxID=57062 RepID=A0ABD1EYJ3_HYPHA
MSTNDLDPHLLKCIGLLYESRQLRKGDSVPLQHILEDAIFQKTGVVKDYTDIFQSHLLPRESDEPVVAASIYDELGDHSDNDLELDDLSCVVCNKMDVGVRNRLLECRDCHALYHQECHKPAVIEEDVTESWTCSNCRPYSVKKLKISEKEHVPVKSSSSSSSSSKSESHRHSTSSSSSHKSSSEKYKSSSKSSSSGSRSSNSSPSHSRSEDKKSSSKSGKSSSKYYSEKRKHD